MPDASADTSIEEDLKAAFDKADAAAAEPSTPAVETPEPAAAAAPEKPEPAAEGGQARGADGKFIPKAEGAPPPKPEEAQAGVAAKPAAIGHPQATPAAPISAKAPQSWKPAVRELAAKLPAEFQPILDESVRREREHAVALQKHAESQRQLEPLLRTLQPYAQGLQQRGMDLAQTVGSFLRTEQALSDPNPQTRAAVLAQAIRTYNVPIEALAAALDGAAPAQAQHQPQIDPQQIEARVWQKVTERLEQGRAQSAELAATAELEKFIPQAEFLDTVRDDMARLYAAYAADNAQRRQAGEAEIDLPIQEAYERACWSNPETRAIFQQREASKQAATSQEATQRAHKAGSTVRSQPGGHVAETPPESWEDAVARQMAD